MKNNLIFVITDGIQNTVFESQVIIPLLKKKENYKICLVSYEKESKDLEQKYPEIKFVIFKTNIFLTKLSLIPSIFKLKKFLKNFDSYDLIARGPVAGYICQKSADKNCKNLTIQARGLLAQEYFYVRRNENFIKKFLHFIRARSYHNLEKCVYNKKNNSFIESVTPALKDFLISNYKARPENIDIAKYDIPEKITPEKFQTNRIKVRQSLNIQENIEVYCYNGSAHAWQCPEQMIKFFKLKLDENPNSFLLILSQNKNYFEKLLKQYSLPQNSYKVLTLKHDIVFEYLCAADYGIIFREKHIINWVARPTKVLEYQAAGLKILHNNTVKLLIDND
ncbi:hypothetical protein M1446_02595 [Candidatus Dependentiae bacterium]|nr:hypothetical protein [Candidatus Dependentiae bacterium]